MIDKSQMIELARVGSLYTTGGGIAFRGQKAILEKVGDKFVEIKEAEEFDENDYVIRIGGIGPSTAGEISIPNNVKRMVKILEQISERKIVGIYPPEIGQEAFVISCAIAAGLPVINFEPAGVRAKPCVDISVFNLLGMDYSIAPLVITTTQGEIISVHDKLPQGREEIILRNTTNISSDGTIYVASGLVKIGDLKKYGVINRPYTLFQQVAKMSFDEFLKKEAVKEVFNAKVTKTWKGKLSGFNIDNTEFVSGGKKYRLIFQNEAMFLLDDKKKVVYSVPDRICLIDIQKMEGVWVGDLKEGLEFSVVVLEPEKIWKEHLKEAEEIFGYKRFKSLID